MDKQWYEKFFLGVPNQFWNRLITEEFTEEEGLFLSRILEMSPQLQVMDALGGRGRMSLWLARYCLIEAECWDLDRENIDWLNKQSEKEKLPVRGVVADLTQMSPRSKQFDRGICLGNSFGFFDPDRMNSFIAHVGDALKSGGMWAIHSGMLAECIFPNWRDRDFFEAENWEMQVEYSYHPYLSRVEIESRFRTPENPEGEEKLFYHYIYTLKEITQMLEMKNLKLGEMYSGTDGIDFALGDEQAYLLAYKK